MSGGEAMTIPCAHRDRGAADALALVLIGPVCVAFALLIVSLGRSVESRSETQAAAESAAQAAAHAMLTNPDTCHAPVVDVDTSDFRAGGSVAVTIVCTATNRGVEVVQPAAREYSTRAVARIDPFRATEQP